jgi:hypothetical protein
MTPETEVRVMPGHGSTGPDNLHGAEPRPVRAVKEMNGRPKSRSIRTTKTYRGIAYGARALGRRSARSSRGGHVPPGGSGKPATGQRGTGGPMFSCREVCVMQSAEAVLDIIRERGSASPEWTTGEPCVGKLTSTVRGGADGKGPASWAPRRRPTPPGRSRPRPSPTIGRRAAQGRQQPQA